MPTNEKRQFARIDSLNLSYLFVNGKGDEAEKQLMARTLNVSEAGILLETHIPIAVDRHLTMSIGLVEDLVDIKGKVVHSAASKNGKYEIGVVFLTLDEKSKQTLKKFIEAFGKHLAEHDRGGE